MSETTREGETLDIAQAVNDTCPWSGKPIAADSLARYRGRVVGFCNPGCRDEFVAATAHFDAAIDAAEEADQTPLIAKGLD
ncbi:glutathione S-transferase [Salinarimonas chemoclinalis]|uniref:glutathione S-transferase n=1 Tax=Salinarimonas chemoclinalis TaxID=3241599 RepID=UPI00355863D9